ncbi:hypothetical protein [Massilia sp. Mn16-1_5]|uniref:hypothetical protein n=1 Tax=Massilia sp. Mn16-1_5 TaxID=2079199 RepID=UPI00109E5694|nr:hypothetical protein [Massilia sp. Mn16-1_5]
MEQLICSHKYKATVSVDPLSAAWKFFELFFSCLLHNASETKKASRNAAGLSESGAVQPEKIMITAGAT